MPDAEVQRSLFDDNSKMEKMAKIYTTIDVLSEKFGKYTVHHAASLATKIQAQHEGEKRRYTAKGDRAFQRRKQEAASGISRASYKSLSKKGGQIYGNSNIIFTG